MRLRRCARDVASFVNTIVNLLLGLELLQGANRQFCRSTALLSIPRTVGETFSVWCVGYRHQEAGTATSSSYF